MNRLSRRAVSVLVVAAVAIGLVAASAQAKRLHVTGQQTVITPSAQATQFLTANNITLSAVAPATMSNGSLTLPITRGVVTTRRLNGALVHRGGITFTNGTRSLTMRSFVLVRIAHRAALTARVHGRRWIVARVRQLSKTVSGNQGTITGELHLSARAARFINRTFGKHVVSAGADLGSLKSTVTVG